MNEIYANAINEVIRDLIPAGVLFTVKPIYDGMQIRFPWCDGDVACHKGTYGSNDGCVETYCFPWDGGDVSMLTPEEAADHIIEMWEGREDEIDFHEGDDEVGFDPYLGCYSDDC